MLNLSRLRQPAKENVRVATIQRVGLDGTTPTYNNVGGANGTGQITWVTGPVTIDGAALANGNRMLLQNEQDGSGLGGDANGIWVRTSQNTWDRAQDFDDDADVRAGVTVFATEGTINADVGFELTTNDPIQVGGVGGSSLLWTRFSTFALATVAATQVQAGAAASIGTQTRSAREDHGHSLSTAAPTVTIKSEVTVAAAGTASSVLRSDAQIQASTAAPTVTAKSEATGAGQGVASSLLRSDAQMQVATAAPTVTAKSEATGPGQGAASTMLRSDAQLQVATAAPTVTVKSEVTAAAQGAASTMLRSDAQIQAATAAPSVEVKTDAAAAAQGTSASLLRSDAQLVVDTAAPGTSVKTDAAAAAQGTAQTSLRSDAQLVLDTAAPSVTVKSDVGAAAQGTATSALRSDAQLTAATAAPVDVALANAQGTSASLSRADHVHKLPDSVPRWEKVTFDYTDLAAAALTNDIEAYSLPAGWHLHAVKVKHSTLFSGGTISDYKVSVGLTGSLALFLPLFDVDTAVAAGNLSSFDVGSHCESQGAATSIRLAAVAAGDDLDQATQGEVDVWLLVSGAV